MARTKPTGRKTLRPKEGDQVASQKRPRFEKQDSSVEENEVPPVVTRKYLDVEERRVKRAEKKSEILARSIELDTIHLSSLYSMITFREVQEIEPEITLRYPKRCHDVGWFRRRRLDLEAGRVKIFARSNELETFKVSILKRKVTLREMRMRLNTNEVSSSSSKA